MDGAEAPPAVSGGARGYGDEDESLPGPGRGVEGARQAPGQFGAQPGLPMAFEGQQALRQLGPVCPGRHHGQQHGAVHVNQGRSLGLCPERPERQQAQLTGARAAECRVLRPAADAVHWNGQGEHLSRRFGCPVAQPRQRPRVAPAVSAALAVAGARSGSLPGPGWCGCPSSDPGPGAPPVVPGGPLCGQLPGRNLSRSLHRHPGDGGAAAVVRGGAGQPGNEGSMGPLSCGDQPLPSRWKIPSADWP